VETNQLQHWHGNRHSKFNEKITIGALGFRSYCAVIPDHKVGLIWLSNRGDLMEDELSEMVDGLLAAAIK